MQSLEELISLYGVAIIFVGKFLEGETIVVVAGFLSHQEILNPFAVAISSFLGSFFGDQLWFYLGRRYATHRLVKRIIDRPIFDKLMSTIEKHPVKFILTFRFIYGIRTISPVALGLTDIKVRTFLVFNAIAAALWAATFTMAGYAFGQTVEALLGDIKAIEQKLAIALGIALIIFASYRIVIEIRRRRLRNRLKMKTG